MLTADEEDFLSKQTDRVVAIKPFYAKIARVAEKIKKQILDVSPTADIHFLGASSLGLSGQNDIDLYIFSKPRDFNKYVPVVSKLFGEFKNQKYDSVAWKFEKEEIPVELYVTDPSSEPMKRQIAVHDILSRDKNLRTEYEELKEKFDGKSWKDMQRAKFEFYHKILGE